MTCKTEKKKKMSEITNRQVPFPLLTGTREDSELDSQRISNELPSLHLQLKSEKQGYDQTLTNAP